MENLMQWGRENGLDTSRMKLVNYAKDFRGIHAAKRIKKDDIIIRIPEKFFVFVDKIVGICGLAKKVLECGLELDYAAATAIACFVYENKKDPKSWWKLYADSFPSDASSFPYFFKPDELQYLKGTTIESTTILFLNRAEST